MRSPASVTRIVLTADAPGEYYGQCAEFCGASHANMRHLAVVETPEAFAAWAAKQKEPAATRPTARRPRRASSSSGRGRASAATRSRGVSGGGIGPDLTHVGSPPDDRRRHPAEHAGEPRALGPSRAGRRSPGRSCPSRSSPIAEVARAGRLPPEPPVAAAATRRRRRRGRRPWPPRRAGCRGPRARGLAHDGRPQAHRHPVRRDARSPSS